WTMLSLRRQISCVGATSRDKLGFGLVDAIMSFSTMLAIVTPGGAVGAAASGVCIASLNAASLPGGLQTSLGFCVFFFCFGAVNLPIIAFLTRDSARLFLTTADDEYERAIRRLGRREPRKASSQIFGEK
ncbi:hypothetical protein ACFL34_02800, partial [Candidatus Sumerlaeota bacterium]